MINILYILNKNVVPGGDSKYWPYFLKYLQEDLKKKNINMRFVFLNKDFKKYVFTKNNLWYENKEMGNYDVSELFEEANSIEKKYKFTFKQAYYSEILQKSTYSYIRNHRLIHLPENIVSDLSHLVDKFKFVNNIIIDHDFDIVLSDQSVDAEIEFARAICLKETKPFLRIWPDFLDRRSIFKEGKFGQSDVVEAVIDEHFSYEMAENYLNEYLQKKSASYSPTVFFSNSSYLDKIRAYLSDYRLPIITILKMIIMKIIRESGKPFYYFENIRKNILNDKFDKDKKYLFWGFHLTTEATIGYRGLPYLSQTNLIESISRVLPFGYFLYVREHPSHRNKLQYRHLQKLSKLPNIRIISTKISIHDILKHSRGVITYNATTGIEALMYGKPVLSFAPNVYYKHHPAVDYCTNLYQLGSKLTNLVNTKVKRKDTILYLQKRFQTSNNIPMESMGYLSIEDAKQKAEKLSMHLKKAFDICLQSNESIDV